MTHVLVIPSSSASFWAGRVNPQQTFAPKLPPASVQKLPTGTKILPREATPFHIPKLDKQQHLFLGSSFRAGVDQHTSSLSVRTSSAALRYVCEPKELFIIDRPLFLLYKPHGVARRWRFGDIRRIEQIKPAL
jgi:hypothetical protein